MGSVIKIALFSFFLVCTLYAIETEDLGSVKKNHSKPSSNGAPQVDYSKLKKVTNSNAVKTNPEEATSLVTSSSKTNDEDISFKSKDKTPFYKKLGSITIRASEEYVYIRAGKSAVIMNAQGKVLIDSAQDLLITSKADVVIKAGKDIVLQPQGEVKMPAQKTESSKN